MSLKKIVNDLRKIQEKAKNKLSKNPKNKNLKEINEILNIVIKGIEEAAEKEEIETKKQVIGRYVIEIDGHRFIKYKNNDEKIELWIEDKGWQYLQEIDIPKAKSNLVKEIEGLKWFVENWYSEKVFKVV